MFFGFLTAGADIGFGSGGGQKYLGGITGGTKCHRDATGVSWEGTEVGPSAPSP